MRALSIGMSLAACLVSVAPAQGQEFGSGGIVWPASGRYPGYPGEPDERRIRFSVSGGVQNDSNVFRLADGEATDNSLQSTFGTTKKSDTISRIGAGLTGDIPVGRQHLVFDGAVDYNDYSRFDLLDHVAYRANAAWNWLVASQWSGDVGYSTQRYLNTLDLDSPVEDLVTEDHAYVSAAWQLTPRWRARGAGDWYRWDHSEETRDDLDRRAGIATLGLDYVTPARNSVGGQVKYTRGDYPNPQFVAGQLVSNNFDEVELSAVAHWVATGVSTLNGRLGYTNRKHDELSERDFDGITGRLELDWTPMGKTIFLLAAWREIRAPEDITASYVVSHGASVGPRWAPTVKLVFQADLIYERRDFEGDPGLVLAPGPQREDKFVGGRIAAGYAPFRNAEIVLSATSGKRTSNDAVREYDYNVVGADLRFSF